MKAFIVFMLLMPATIAIGVGTGFALIQLADWIKKRQWTKRAAIVSVTLLIPLSLAAAIAVWIWL